MGWMSTLLRFVGVSETPNGPPVGGAATSTPVSPGYDVHASLTAFVQFPWVRACLDAISTDLAGLPLVVVRGEGADAEVVNDPALSALLQRPTSWQTRAEWESTLIVHLLLCGNAYDLLVGIGRPTSLPLLHPERVRVIPGPFGGPDGYVYTDQGGGERVYSPEIVTHYRLTAWEQGPQGLLGEGLIRALQADLNADLNAARLAARTARQGRPSAVFSPSAEGDQWPPEVREAIAKAYARIVEEQRPAMVLSSGTKVEFPSFTPRDMEYSEARSLTRETVLAAFGVPPTRVGLPAANYATAREQSAIYWHRLIGLARLLDQGLTTVAKRFDPAYSVRHDFSAVDALQEARTARLDRVSTWVLLGASAADAAAYEGFDDAPVSAVPADQVQAQAASIGARVLPMKSAAVPALSAVAWLKGDQRREIDADSPRLEDSIYLQPPRDYCEQLKAEYPDIWQAGGNERGPEAFEYWGKYLDGDRSEGVLAWVVEREAWGARHYEDGDAFVGDDPATPTLSNVGGIVAWLKWGLVGQLGWPKMRDLIEQLKDSLDQAESSMPLDEDEADRAARWRGWLDEVHAPSERELAISLRRALRQQAAQVAKRLGDLEAKSMQRGMIDVVLAAIFPDSVRNILALIAKNALERAVRVAWGRAAREVGSTLDRSAADGLARDLLARMSGQVNSATADAILAILGDGINQGQTINEMQGRIMDATAFAPSRSLAISRTETTRAASASASAAWGRTSEATGTRIRRAWLAARDGSVREAHSALDGQVVELGELFVVPASGGQFSGAKGMGPGEFSAAGMCVNCRCTVIPVVED